MLELTAAARRGRVQSAVLRGGGGTLSRAKAGSLTTETSEDEERMGVQGSGSIGGKI